MLSKPLGFIIQRTMHFIQENLMEVTQHSNNLILNFVSCAIFKCTLVVYNLRAGSDLHSL